LNWNAAAYTIGAVEVVGPGTGGEHGRVAEAEIILKIKF
jgi:hypothetical protein